MGFHTFTLAKRDLALANGYLELKVPTISHFTLAERDLAIVKLTHRGWAPFSGEGSQHSKSLVMESIIIIKKIKQNNININM